MSSTPSENPYAAPCSNLQETAPTVQVPSIEEALTRGYNFGIDALINEAWQRLKGAKGTLIASMLVIGIAALALYAAIKLGLNISGLSYATDSYKKIINQLVGLLLTPLLAGQMLIGVRRATGNPISIKLITSQLGRAAPLIVTSLLVSALTFLGFFLLIIPGIYLSVAYMLAIPLVMERGLSPWQAMEASRKAITQHWFKVLGLFLTLGLMLIVSAIPLGIGLIWTLPLTVICMGILYRTIFGVLPVTP
jgi:uncharacterized membrane protein